MSEHLLPPGTSSPIEMGFSYIWDTYTRWHHLIQQIPHIGVTYTPDAWVPIFVWDYGLEDILPYVTNMQMALAEGPRWQRIRGTQTGIKMGVGWVDVTATIDPPDQRLHWSQFQLELPETVHDLDHIKRIDGIARLSKAAEDSLYRLFNPVRDHRPIRMNRHKFAGGRFNGYSGERLWPDGPLISFGTVMLSEAASPINSIPAMLSRQLPAAISRGKSISAMVSTQLAANVNGLRKGWPQRWPSTGWETPISVWSIQAKFQ